MALVVFGALVGIACALRHYVVYVMLPVGALLAVSTVLSGAAFHTYWGAIVAEVFAAIAASQLTYLAVPLIKSRGPTLAG